MEIAEVFSRLESQFGSDSGLSLYTDAIDPWIEVPTEHIAAVCTYLRDDPDLLFNHLNDLCGVDYLETDEKKAAKAGFEPHVEVVYQLSSFDLKHRIKLKVMLPRWQDDEQGRIPRIPTVSSVFGIADWHERECFDLVGIEFVGHPNHKRILCPDDWIGHPLRKDYEFPLEYHGIRGK